MQPANECRVRWTLLLQWPRPRCYGLGYQFDQIGYSIPPQIVLDDSRSTEDYYNLNLRLGAA